MDCPRVRELVAAYDLLDAEEQRQELERHLATCLECEYERQRFSELRSGLRRLPVLKPPEHLITSLRILASQAPLYRAVPSMVPVGLARWWIRTKLWIDGIMKPLAIPMAGGLVSAMVLFALLGPGLALPVYSGGEDVPTMLSTSATFLGMGPFGFTADEIVLDVVVDSRGALVEYSSPPGYRALLKDPAVRRSIENALLFAVISPGTTFGRPTGGKLRITLRRSAIDVRG